MTENEYKQLQEVFEGRYVEIRDTFADTLKMLRRATEKVDAPEEAMELAEWIFTFGKHLLASDVTFRSTTCGFSGGGSG